MCQLFSLLPSGINKISNHIFVRLMCPFHVLLLIYAYLDYQGAGMTLNNHGFLGVGGRYPRVFSTLGGILLGWRYPGWGEDIQV